MFSGAATKMSQALPRAANRAGIGNPQRGIHTSTRPKFFQAPTIVTRIIARILPSQIPASSSSIQSGITLGARTLHQSSVHSSIRQGLSFPARVSLSSPLHAPRLPRVPALPRSVAHVGLGTARNFSSARPLFQNIVDNVPVVGRSLWEADWDTRCMEEVKARKVKARRTAKKPTQERTQEMLKPASKIVLSSVNTEEMGHYFPEAAPPAVITYLQIPLAPTPTARLPLSMTPNGPELIPLPTLAKSHALHADHSGRVSQLFARLDNARVWERGASVEALGDRTGLCTVLRVKFEGWNDGMVKEVIGVHDAEWCIVQEIRPYDDIGDDVSSQSSGLDSTLRSPVLSPLLGPILSDSSSVEFVMPSLDFSSSFLSVADHPVDNPPRPASPLFSDIGSDESFSDIHFSGSSDSELEEVNDIRLPQPSLGGSWFAFSSDFRNHAGIADDFYF